jgi:hypothetical protein
MNGSDRADLPPRRAAADHQKWNRLAEAERQPVRGVDGAWAERKRAKSQYIGFVRQERERKTGQLAEHNISSAVRRAVIAEFEAAGRLCCICGGVVGTGEKYHIHHKIPVSAGGTRSKDNLCVAHARCNLRDAIRAMWEAYLC